MQAEYILNRVFHRDASLGWGTHPPLFPRSRGGGGWCIGKCFPTSPLGEIQLNVSPVKGMQFPKRGHLGASNNKSGMPRWPTTQILHLYSLTTKKKYTAHKLENRNSQAKTMEDTIYLITCMKCSKWLSQTLTLVTCTVAPSSYG